MIEQVLSNNCWDSVCFVVALGVSLK